LLKLQRLAGNQVVAQLLSVQRLKKDVTPELLVHIFHGEKGAGGEITGYHSENEKDAEKTIAAVSKAAKRSPADPVGVYTAAPVVAKAGVAKPGKSGKGGKDGGKGLKDKTSGSSFFPAAWDRATVAKVVAESTRSSKSPKYNRVGAHDGQDVLMKLAGYTLYPVYTPMEVEGEGSGSKKKKGAKKKKGK
jgi:Bacterial EndoU nuclease